MLYAQARGIKSLRDIHNSLMHYQRRWYHIGLQSVARSTLSDANAKRSAEIFKGIFYELLERCQGLAPKHRFTFKNPLYTMDSTVIHLCLSLFPWARFRTRKGALKIHTLLDHSGCLPSFVTVTDGKCHDIRVVQDSTFSFPGLLPDSIITVDRAYIDYTWLYTLTKRRVFFVTRAKRNIQYTVTGQHAPSKHKNVIADQKIRLTGFYQTLDYPDSLRLITYYDTEIQKNLIFLTNNFTLSAKTIADLYKARWQIEIFFKWIKQNLKIKTFFGTSENAVMTQIWIAMIYYLLLCFIKFQTKYPYSLHILAQMFNDLLMDTVTIIEILQLNSAQYQKLQTDDYQLSFL
jgi:hypothetical protein